MGQEGEGGSVGLTNAVILAEPNAEFLRLWYDSYRKFRSKGRDIFWNEHSVKVPAILAGRYPELITTLPHEAFFWPRWHPDHLKMIYKSTTPIVTPQTYATHLWETHAWKYLESLTPGQVRRLNANFHLWARPYVANLADNFGAPTIMEQTMTTIYRKPRRMIRTSAQKIMRGGRVLLHGRASPNV
jgi:hypothetical protein